MSKRSKADSGVDARVPTGTLCTNTTVAPNDYTPVTILNKHVRSLPPSRRAKGPVPLLVGIEPNPGPTSPALKLAAAALAAKPVMDLAKKLAAPPPSTVAKKSRNRRRKAAAGGQGLLRAGSRSLSQTSVPQAFGYNFSTTNPAMQSTKISVQNVGVRCLTIAAQAPGSFGGFKFSDGVNYNIYGLDMNPSAGGGSKPATFGGALAQLADLFTLFRITKCKARWVPVLPTSVGSPVFLCCTPDPVDTTPANELVVTQASPNFSFPAWQETELTVPPYVFQGAIPWYMCAIATFTVAADMRNAAPFSFQGGWVNMSAATVTADALVGYLFFDVDIELRGLTRNSQLGRIPAPLKPVIRDPTPEPSGPEFVVADMPVRVELENSGLSSEEIKLVRAYRERDRDIVVVDQSSVVRESRDSLAQRAPQISGLKPL